MRPEREALSLFEPSPVVTLRKVQSTHVIVVEVWNRETIGILFLM